MIGVAGLFVCREQFWRGNEGVTVDIGLCSSV